MFTHLIESGSHKKDMARRGRFFLGTFGFYGLLLLVAGVASVYAYDSHLGKQNSELYTLTAIMLPPAEARAPDRARAAAGGERHNELNQRASAIAPLLGNTRPPATISTEPNRSAEIPRNNAPYVVTGRDVTTTTGGVFNVTGGDYLPGDTNRTAAPAAVVVPVAPDDDPPPTPAPTPVPVRPRQQLRVSSSVINSKIISKPAPAYPTLAKQARVQGAVTVEILIDEQGRVVSAQVTNGHPLLRAAAQQSAYQARFSPTSISGQPVKVSGVITYNFILQ